MCSQTRYWRVTGLGPEQAEFLHRRFSWEKKTFVKVSSFKRGGCDAGARNWSLTIRDARRLEVPFGQKKKLHPNTSNQRVRSQTIAARRLQLQLLQITERRLRGCAEISSVFVKLPVAELLSVEGNTEEGKKFAAHGEA